MSGTLDHQGLDYEPIQKIMDLQPGDWLIVNFGVIGEWKPFYLTVIGPTEYGLGCHRHGRNTAARMTLDQGAVDAGRVWRASTQPDSGLPGTWCDGLDDDGENCGRSLLHKGRHWH